MSSTGTTSSCKLHSLERTICELREALKRNLKLQRVCESARVVEDIDIENVDGSHCSERMWRERLVNSSNSTKGLDAQITPFAGSDEDWGKPSDSCGVMKPSTTLFEGAQATAQFRSLVRRAQTGRHLIIAPKAEKLVMIAARCAQLRCHSHSAEAVAVGTACSGCLSQLLVDVSVGMAALPIHLRAKRGKQTVFLVADPSDTVRLLKARLSDINRVAPDRIRIIAADEVRGVA